MNTQTTHEFLIRCFHPGETIALLLRKESPASTTQRIVTLEQAIAPRYLAWLRYENHNGANVYVAANPLRSGSRKRTKDCIAEVRHLYLDIDVDGEKQNLSAHGVGGDTHSDRHSLDIAGQVPSAMEGRRIRLRPAGKHAEATRHSLRRRLRLHRPQPCPSRAGIPELQVRFCPPTSRSNITATPPIVLRTSGWRIQFSIPISSSAVMRGRTW